MATIAESVREFDRSIGAIILSVILFVIRLLMTLAFMSPAIMMNLASLQNRGQVMCFASIVLVLGAAFAVHCLMHRPAGQKLFFLIMAPVLVFMSMFTAVRNIGGIRETAVEARQAHAEAKEGLKAKRAALDARRKAQVDVAGEVGKSVYEEQINEVKRSPLYGRSSNCDNATIPASIALCRKFSEAKTKLAAAIERDKLQGLIDGLNVKAEAPQVAAPLGVAVSNDALLRMIEKAGVKMDGSEIDYSYEAGFVLALELLAAGAPVMFGLVLPDLRRRRLSFVAAETFADASKTPVRRNPLVAASLPPVLAAAVEAVAMPAGDAINGATEALRDRTKKASEARARKKRQANASETFGNVDAWRRLRTVARVGASA